VPFLFVPEAEAPEHETGPGLGLRVPGNVVRGC
jgi:hypothetical protein